MTRWVATPRRRRLLAFVLGIVAVLALPPVNLVIALVPALAGLLWLLDFETRGRGVAWLGWLFGFGHFLAGLHWLVHPFLVDAARHAWIAPIALSALAAWMAVFPALALWLTWRCRAQGVSRVLVFAAAWTFGEWLRGWLLTGFSWNLLATAWNDLPAMMQTAALVGALGLSLVTVLAAAMPVAALQGARGGRVATGLALAGLVLLWGAGTWWLDHAATDNPSAAPRVRIVQPNIDQREKWKPENRRAIFERLIGLSRGDGAERPDIIIWPEAATPFYLDENPGALAIMGDLLASGGVVLTGTPRRGLDSQGVVRYWNSVLAVDSQGDVVGRYDKAHLVPFGEYVPLEEILPLEKMVEGLGSFSAGTPAHVVRLDGLPPTAPLICYEALFAEEIHFGADRPAWLVNVTNDAWFGPGAGPRQHLAAARLRAVEQGLPMLRAANTGISAVIDAHGRVLARLPLNSGGILDAALPPPLPATPYARLGLAAPALLFGLCLLLAVLAHRGLVRRPVAETTT